jgi:hypothetical protein
MTLALKLMVTFASIQFNLYHKNKKVVRNVQKDLWAHFKMLPDEGFSGSFWRVLFVTAQKVRVISICSDVCHIS